MLRFAEELLLFLLDEERGALLSLPLRTMNLAFAGAVLMDLQFANRIDTDLDTLVLTDPTPLGDDLLDPVLADIAASEKPQDAAFWVERCAGRGEALREQAAARLVEREILLAPDEDGLLSLTPLVSRTRRYALEDGTVREAGRQRVMRVIFSDDLPDPADIAIISLADACGIFERMMSAEELRQVRDRIALFSQMDLIGRAVARTARVVGPVSGFAGERGPSRRIPVARGLPLIGLSYDILHNGVRCIVESYNKLGPVFRVRISALRPLEKAAICLAGPEANLFLQRRSSHFRSVDQWQRMVRDVGSTRGLLGMDGADHYRMRRELRDGLGRRRISDHLPEAVEIIRRQTADWPLQTAMPGLRAVQRLITGQVVALCARSSSTEYLDDAIFLFDRLFNYVVIPVLTPSRRHRRARRRMIEWCEKTLAEHQMRENRREPDLIDDLLALHHADPVFMPELDLTVSALIPFIGAFDTAAITASFMLYFLLKHPELLERAQAEADALFACGGGGGPTLQGVREMDVIQRVMLETMRLRPAASFLSRIVQTTFEFNGYRVAAGEKVYTVPVVSHYLPRFYPEPHRFDIDRYLPGREEHKQPGAYAPFGWGAHRCLGSAFAEVQLPLVLATLLHDNVLALDPPGYEMNIRQHLPFTKPAKSFKFKLVGRR